MVVTSLEDRPVAGRQPRRWGGLFAVVWLVYLLQPVHTAWTSPDVGTGARVLALTALGAFAVGFAVFFGWLRAVRSAGPVVARPVVAGALVAGVLLLVLAEPAAGEDVLVGYVYLGVAAVMGLPLREALFTVAGLVFSAIGLGYGLPGWQPQWDFLPELLLACFAAYGVDQVLLRNVELTRAREQIVELAISRERERLARDVHDILGHSLTVITVKSELVGRLLEDAGPERARVEVAEIEQLARGALADVRATVAGTREVSLAGELVAARRALASAGIEAELPGSVEAAPAAHRELFAWTLREGITNVVRHSAARHCAVRWDTACLEVVDDGRGIGVTAAGTGLAGLRARAEAAGAVLESGPVPGGGFRLRLVVA
ncbi:two-component system, NarL family, sensor histidine kinase DesK [Klenkia soli]|uniref:Two-component system, NarL family, sensor histidine kinase DesK n=1 Tax=Klenkia soli TaxID=1052260 RepID=A0A1H0KXS0_9ACTN|nr:sensor histidine kinase [Klenkia soli]SDO60655.1 two-component system, NarL family, sensor histidine kinase DesK [Klenkia soli]